jgi:hypothetical protein
LEDLLPPTTVSTRTSVQIALSLLEIFIQFVQGIWQNAQAFLSNNVTALFDTNFGPDHLKLIWTFCIFCTRKLTKYTGISVELRWKRKRTWLIWNSRLYPFLPLKLATFVSFKWVFEKPGQWTMDSGQWTIASLTTTAWWGTRKQPHLPLPFSSSQPCVPKHMALQEYLISLFHGAGILKIAVKSTIFLSRPTKICVPKIGGHLAYLHRSPEISYVPENYRRLYMGSRFPQFRRAILQ